MRTNKKRSPVKRLLSSVTALGSAVCMLPAMPAEVTLPAITAKAATGSVTLSSDGVLTLSGEVTKEQIWEYRFNWDVASIVAAPGTILPEDCSHLFSNYNDGSNHASNPISWPYVNSVDLSCADASRVKNMSCMFSCGYTHSGTSSSYCSINLSGLDASNVTDMSDMFYNCLDLTELNLSNFDTSNVTDMKSMFEDCIQLTELDLSSFDTSNVTDMSLMFNMISWQVSNLKKLDLSSFDTSNVTSMKTMFGGCTKLTELDLSSFDTSNVTDMSLMFNMISWQVSNLKKLDLSSFDTSNVTSMKTMFGGCTKLTELDLSSFDTSNVTDMRYMFAACSGLTELDLSSFDTSNVTDMTAMFWHCNVQTIFVSSLWKVNNVSESSVMFDRCSNIVGGNGTVYDGSKTDKEYARIDGGADAPGYLTDKDKNVKYKLSIAGTQVTENNRNDILGNGAFSYDPASNVLAVKKSYTAPNDSTLLENLISGLTINIQNDVTLSTNAYNGFLIHNDTTIKGGGVLTLNAGKTGISVTDNASLYLDNLIADITAEYYGIKGDDPQGNYGAQTKEKLLVCNSDIDATGWAYGAITDFSSIKLTKCHADMPLYMDGFYFYDPNYDFDPAEEVVISAEWTSDLFVADAQVTYQNAGDILGDGKVSYDRRSKTLTISGDYRYSGNNYFISNGIDDLIIKVASDSTIDVANKFAFGSFHHNMTITGPGKLTMNGGIYMGYAKLTIRDANLDVRFYFGIKGYPFHDSLAIINSMIHAEGVYGAVCDFENGITLQDCHITVPDNAIYSGTDICNSDGSSAKVVDIVPGSALAITAQPKNVTAEAGATAQFTVEATGENLSYQWQVNTGDGWKNSGAASAKTPTLSFTVAASRDGYKYRCKVTAAGSTSVTSKTVTLKVKPTITTQPANFTGEAGSTAKFTVAATGAGTLSYQWQYNAGSGWKDSGAASAKTAELSFSVAVSRDGYQYRCKVTAPNGTSTTSKAATLKVRPTITTQPKNFTGAVGTTAKFTVAATGAGTLSYQWQVNTGDGWKDSNAASAKTATISFTVSAAREGYQYRCKVTAPNGTSKTSSAATLKVQTAITTQPKNFTGAVGSTAKYTIAATGAGTMSYQWQVNTGSGWKDSNAASAKTATLSFTVSAAREGYQYRCIVTAPNGTSATSNAVSLKVQTAITTQPKNLSCSAGSTAKFTVAATGAGTLSYQWQVNTGSGWKDSNAASAKTATLSFTATAARSGYQYRCKVTSTNGTSKTSSAATLTVK